MRLLGLFRRPPPIADTRTLEDFVDERASFMIQKNVFEHSRARAGIMWEKLFKEPAFKAAIDAARWHGYPLALANVVEMVEGVLRPHAAERAEELPLAMLGLSKAVIRRYPVPPGEPDHFWDEAEVWLEQRLASLQSGPPKPVKDIPNSTAREMYELLPIHPSLRPEDLPLIRNHLAANLCRMHEDFIQRAQIEHLVADLLVSKPAQVAEG